MLASTSVQLHGNTHYRLTYVHTHFPADGSADDRPAILSLRIASKDPDSILIQETVNIQSTDTSGKISGYWQYRKLLFRVPGNSSVMQVTLQFNYTEKVRTF